MSILSDLPPFMKIAASQPPSTDEAIKTLVDFSPIPVPGDYLDLVKQGSDVEIGVDLKDGGNWFIRIYGADSAVEMNKANEVQRDLKHSLAAGDNEGGDMLVIVGDANPPGIYLIPMSCLSDLDDATYVAKSLTEMLSGSIHLDLLF